MTVWPRLRDAICQSMVLGREFMSALLGLLRVGANSITRDGWAPFPPLGARPQERQDQPADHLLRSTLGSEARETAAPGGGFFFVGQPA